MALEQNNDITPQALVERFQAAVVDNILSGAFHAGNPPMLRGNQCVPIEMMDHINNVNRIPTIGNKNDIVNATSVLNGLINLTRNLTRVGTFAFTVWMQNSEDGTDSSGNANPKRSWNTLVEEKSGKVIFTAAQVRQEFGNPADIQGTTYGETIKASNLNQLFSNIFSTWSTCNRHEHSGHCEICHCVCHWNCHYNCHRNCHSTCHGWTIIKDQ